MLPIALFRIRGGQKPYVYCNPLPDAYVFEEDQIFLFAGTSCLVNFVCKILQNKNQINQNYLRWSLSNQKKRKRKKNQRRFLWNWIWVKRKPAKNIKNKEIELKKFLSQIPKTPK